MVPGGVLIKSFNEQSRLLERKGSSEWFPLPTKRLSLAPNRSQSSDKATNLKTTSRAAPWDQIS